MSQATKAKEDKAKTIDNYDDLETNLRAIQRNWTDLHDPYLEITQGFMDVLMKGTRTENGRPITSCTYGKPGVKLYVEGTRETTEKENAMSAEDRAVYEAQKRKLEPELQKPRTM